MDYIKRYVHEVGRKLPRKGREDIEAELHSTLVDALEDRAGDAPTEQDELDLLKEFGSPDAVAASYRGHEEYLIGPELYPFFRMVMGIVLTVFATVQLILLGVMLVFDTGATFSVEWIFEFLGGLLSAFGSVVLVFTGLQYFGVRPEAEDEPWDPRSLPEVVDQDPVSAGGLLGEITFAVILITILLFLPDILNLLIARGVDVVANPVLQDYMPLIITGLLLGILLNVVLLWRGTWTTITRLAKVGVNLFVIGVLYALIAGHSAWLAANGVGTGLFSVFEHLPESGALPFERTQILVVWGFRMAFIVAFVVTIIDTLQITYKLIRSSLAPAGFELPSGGSTAG
jgi:hypothetical protein